MTKEFLCLAVLGWHLVTFAAEPEITWSVMHPTAIDTNYMARVIEKAADYGGVDSFEVCGLEQKGINALSLFERYPHAAAKVDRAFVERTRTALNGVCRQAHAAGKKVYFWHRENLVTPGIFEDMPELLDEDGEFNLLGAAYEKYLRDKIGEVFMACPELDGLVLTLTESEYSVLHNSNQARYGAVKVVKNLIGIFTNELSRRGKRFILRSFGNGEDYAKIIDGATAAAKELGVAFEIETKVTQADFVPWLPKNPYLKRNPPLALGAECDALGEFLGAGYLPAAQVGRIHEYVASARAEGATRYAIRIDRHGFSLFDSAQEVNLYAYMRFIRDEEATADVVLGEYAAKHFGKAAAKMIPLLKSELEMVRNLNYIASNLTFHVFPVRPSLKYVKAGGIFSLYRENASLENMRDIWSIFHEDAAPTHAQILREKDEGVAMAQAGLKLIESLKTDLPEAEYLRQHRAFTNAVVIARAQRVLTRSFVAYFDDMKSREPKPRRLKIAVAEAQRELAALAGTLTQECLEGIGWLCKELVLEYAAERALRRKYERHEVYDFVIPGGIYDDGRVRRMMHAAYSFREGERLYREAGNNRYPNGRIEVLLNAPENAVIEVVLDPSGAAECDVRKSWKNGVWTVSVGKRGAAYPRVTAIVALERTSSRLL